MTTTINASNSGSGGLIQIAAMQEQQALITSLTDRIAALEAK